MQWIWSWINTLGLVCTVISIYLTYCKYMYFKEDDDSLQRLIPSDLTSYTVMRPFRWYNIGGEIIVGQLLGMDDRTVSLSLYYRMGTYWQYRMVNFSYASFSGLPTKISVKFQCYCQSVRPKICGREALGWSLACLGSSSFVSEMAKLCEMTLA